jgi:predicted HTH domain antitoxin
MNLILKIPDDLAGRLSAAGGDLSRRALEALALEEYKSGHVTKGELRRLLGFSTRYEVDGFLKAHEVWADYTIEDLHRELQDLQSLGL